MESSARLFNCAWCQCSVRICTDCDRGNIYCGPVCSETARRSSLRESNKRYQNSRQGRLKHAARQKCYRERQILVIKKVTDQGSQNPTLNDSLFRANKIKEPEKFCCDFCGRSCSTFLRMDFLGNGKRILTNILPVWPNGP